MEKRRIGIYDVECNGIEIGYMRLELDSSRIEIDYEVEVRTPMYGYNSYAHAMMYDLDTYSRMSCIWDLTLVDEYDEYTI